MFYNKRSIHDVYDEYLYGAYPIYSMPYNKFSLPFKRKFRFQSVDLKRYKNYNH